MKKNIIERIEAAGGSYETAWRKEYERISVLQCEFKKMDTSAILDELGGSWIGAGQLGVKQSVVVLYKGEIVFADYIMCDGSSYLESAFDLFKTATPWSKQSKWYNLYCLIVLRDLIRENVNHWLCLDDLLFSEKPLTLRRIREVKRLAKAKDKYATIS